MKCLIFTTKNDDISTIVDRHDMGYEKLRRRLSLGCTRIIETEVNNLPKYPTWDGEKYVSGLGCECEERDWRDSELARTDFSVLPDAPLTDAKKDKYKAYRVSLRNWPTWAKFPDSEQRPKLVL